jgi:peptide/nickel transport system substrate-binding protein
VRRALALAVDNQVILDLGTAGQGIVAENHHVAPVHPEYSPMPPVRDPEAAHGADGRGRAWPISSTS